MDMKRPALILLLVSMALFGCIAICKRSLTDAGLSSFDVTFIRLFVATATITLMMLITRHFFTVKLKDLPFLLLFGLFKFLTDYTYFTALDYTSVSLATVLQNTAPYFVMIVSYFLLRQKVSNRALIAIMVGSFGCVLMSWAALTGTSLDPAGVLFALSSGFFLGMFYIGSDVSITKGYDAAKYMFYMMATAMIISIFFTDVPKVVSSMSDTSVLVNSLILGILMTLVPYYISAWAVKYLGALTVSVISVTEVVFATLVGVLYFNEPIGILDMIGILMMILSVVMISVGSAVQEKKDEGAQST